MLTVCCFKWRPKPGYRSKFDASHVNVLRAMVARHYQAPHRFVCITDDAEGLRGDVRVIPLWPDHANLPSPHGPGNPSCYRRLKLFSREAAALIGPRFVSLDLDAVITGDMRPVWDRPEDFVIWGDTSPGTPYNGSMMLMTAGARAQVWETFDPVRSPKMARQLNYWGSDQAWIGACLGPNEATWKTADGVYSWRVHVRPKQGKLPADARVVMFHGLEDPWQPRMLQQHPWIARHWRQ